MVSKIAFLFSIGLSSFSLFSISLSSFASEMYQCAKSYSEDQRQLSDQNEIELQGIFEDYEHLFPILMPQEAIKNFYADTKKSFVVHFRDSFKNFPRPDFFRFRNINGQFLNPISPINKITGSMKYVGFFSARYAYDIEFANNAFIHKVRIHFKNPKISQAQNDLQDFRLKIQEAQEIWNETPAKEAFQREFSLDFNTRFQFELVTDPRLAHFSVAIADTTRGPYFSEWARNWTPVAIAHEIGHMLGLGDEYQTVSGNDDCLDQSLMCQSWRGELMYHNYYHVLKRLF